MIRKKANPHKYYVPNGALAEFIKMVGDNQTFIVLLSAANGVGKTAGGCATVAHILYGNSGNEYFDYPLFNKFPYPKRGRIISDPTTVSTTLIPELKKWMPAGRYKTEKKGKNFEAFWRTDSGFDFDIMSYEQDVKEFESTTLGWAWFDEPPPLSIFKATVARMRRGGIIFITATPLMGSAWMYDHIVNHRGDNDGQRDFIMASIETNCIQHGERGILEHSHIQRIINEYDEEDKQARIHGKFHHLVGMIFKNFNPKIHVIKPFTLNPRNFVTLEALDPHPRNPDAVLWLATDRHGTKFVVDELYMKGKMRELAYRIQTKSEKFRIIKRICDPSAFVEDQHQDDPEQATFAARLSNEFGLDYERATKDRTAANRRIKDALDYEMVGGEMTIYPELYIFDTCERTIWEIENYQWDDWRGKAAERKNPLEKPMDKDDHMIEDLGRALLQEIEFTPMPRQRGMRVDSTKKIKELDPFA